MRRLLLRRTLLRLYTIVRGDCNCRQERLDSGCVESQSLVNSDPGDGRTTDDDHGGHVDQNHEPVYRVEGHA